MGSGASIVSAMDIVFQRSRPSVFQQCRAQSNSRRLFPALDRNYSLIWRKFPLLILDSENEQVPRAVFLYCSLCLYSRHFCCSWRRRIQKVTLIASARNDTEPAGKRLGQTRDIQTACYYKIEDRGNVFVQGCHLKYQIVSLVSLFSSTLGSSQEKKRAIECILT